ncbi:aldehyde ferredoxin oxidoreductase N-terminal domain-containing protein [Thermodesulfobacterium hydrogeniphilum]|uniref:aldehyde ferredoxin oxidoreductase N-terminal domain-containing protein n=1 Tax=Thermodesulfobacterium hydrogeniphilum TaxID=161156 RepID=UPI00056F55A4|nr:aldehyde ferredoxin oxidoreductase N-terminal domain-containing protein [Thermodesulfobacterium hydrogeniphilum]
MVTYKVLFIDVEKKDWKIKEYPIPPYLGVVDIGVRIHLEELESWKYDILDSKNALFLGTGPFAGGKIFGTHRMVAIFKSPESYGLHVSEVGGVGYKFIGSGINGIVIIGKSPKPVLIFIEGKEKTEVNFKELEEEELYQIFKEYKNETGAYALTLWLLEEYNKFFLENNARAIVVGPGAFQTRLGALVSIDVNPAKKELIIGSEDFAGRGGAGSVLAQTHNVVAIIAGGNIKPDLPKTFLSIKEFNKYFKSITGRDFISAVNSATVKYRFNPKIGTGGTFGSNYPHYKEWLLSFGYNSIYLKKNFRKKIAELILENYWKPFKEKTSERSKAWKTCGEPCPVACKKIWNTKKVDYEPFHGIGPLIGVFDLDIASHIVDFMDKTGIDAIGAGHIVIFILEAINKGLLKPEEVGITCLPNLDPFILNPERWKINGKIALEILSNLIEKKTEVLKLIAELGLREAIQKLNIKYEERIEKIGLSFYDIAIYQPYGEKGYMTPNFYWTPGFVLPIFVTGKYWTEYSLAFGSPEEFAKLVYERAIKELGISNAGFCRFHRGWAENFLENIYKLIGIEDFEEKMKEVYKNIALYNIKAKAIPQHLEGEKGIDIFYTLAEELNVQSWADRFIKDKRRTYQEWFERFFITYLGFIGLSSKEI